MVGLARRLEGKQFHLVATHCQRNPKEQVISYVKSKGLKASSPNMTITSFGGHPKVKGNGHVPYYMVFNHHGELVYDHMCGAYHGGDGLKMIEWVDKLLKNVPKIYVGKAPYKVKKSLAAKIAGKQGLAGAVKKLETELAAAEGDGKTELDRLHAAVTTYRDTTLENADRMIATAPEKVLGLLKGLRSDLKGTALGKPVEEKVETLEKDADLKAAVKISKSFARTKRVIEAQKSCSTCKRAGMKTINLGCGACKASNGVTLVGARKRLEKLIKGKESLPISKTIAAYVKSLQ